MSTYITIFDYLAYNRPDVQQSVVDLMRNEGYTINPRNEADLAVCIKKFVQHMGVEKAMPKLATVHPDRDLILDTVEPTKMNADGLSQPAAKPDQQPLTINSVPQNNSSQTTHIIIAGIAGLALIGMVGIILKS